MLSVLGSEGWGRRRGLRDAGGGCNAWLGAQWLSRLCNSDMAIGFERDLSAIRFNAHDYLLHWFAGPRQRPALPRAKPT